MRKHYVILTYPVCDVCGEKIHFIQSRGFQQLPTKEAKEKAFKLESKNALVMHKQISHEKNRKFDTEIPF